MAEIASLYPRSPAGVPANLARPSLRYRVQVVFVLVPLFFFLLAYLVLLAGSLYLLAWSLFPPGEVTAWLGQSVGGAGGFVVLALFRLGVFLVGALLFGFLFKGFFRRQEDKLLLVEISEQEQGELFQFIRAVCGEIGSRMPARVYLNQEVNAAVTFPTSVVNLVVPPRKDLLIGLGLVNALDLVEFKAILAHEFGHFCQRSLRLGGYTNLVHRIIHNMVYTHDRWDNWLIGACDLPVLSAFAVPLAAVVEFLRTCLDQLFRLLSLAHLSLSRQMEFNADLVAVSVAGSDAPVHALLRSEFYHRALEQAVDDLTLAAEQQWLTTDLFYHQERAAAYLREVQRDAALGQPPELPADAAAQVQVFQPDAVTAATMWASHPSHHDREQNAKRRYVRSPEDGRSAWLLFREPQAVRAEVTRAFYRVCLDIEPDGTTRDPQSVQSFIDEEHAVLKVDPRYHGIYDERLLELANLEQMVEEARKETPPSPQEAAAAAQNLYPHEPPSWPAEHRRRREELHRLEDIVYGDGTGQTKAIEFRGQRLHVSEAPDLLKTVQDEIATDRRREAELDRSVFLGHYHLAVGLGREQEFHKRYQFQRDLQKLMQQVWEQKGQLDVVCKFLGGRKDLQIQELREVQYRLCDVRETLIHVLAEAGQLPLPLLRQMPAGAPLGRFLPADPGLAELDTTDLSLDVAWLGVLNAHVAKVLNKLNRIYLKSLNGILAFQEDLLRESLKEAVALS